MIIINWHFEFFFKHKTIIDDYDLKFIFKTVVVNYGFKFIFKTIVVIYGFDHLKKKKNKTIVINYDFVMWMSLYGWETLVYELF